MAIFCCALFWYYYWNPSFTRINAISVLMQLSSRSSGNTFATCVGENVTSQPASLVSDHRKRVCFICRPSSFTCRNLLPLNLWPANQAQKCAVMASLQCSLHADILDQTRSTNLDLGLKKWRLPNTGVLELARYNANLSQRHHLCRNCRYTHNSSK